MTTSNREEPSARVFVSYSHSDRPVAEEIARALENESISVSFDSWDLKMGDSIIHRIREELSTSDFLIVLLSPESVASRWVREEVDIALSTELRQRSITVVPAILRDCELPSGLLSYLPVDLRQNRAGGIAQLVDRISLARDIDFNQLDPRRFEQLVAEIFQAEGYTVQLTSTTQDGGRDLVLKLPGTEIDSSQTSSFVQVKHYKEQRVTVETIRSAVGTAILAGSKCVIVSSTQLTSAAQELVADVNRKGLIELEVIDGPGLERKVLQHPDLADRYFHKGGQS
jgi:hypothetical protein